MAKRLLSVFVMTLACVSIAFGQGKNITGTVIDEASGFPMPGVNIIIQGTTTGTTTSIDGTYSLGVSGDSDVLVFSFVGYLTQEVTVGNRTVVNVTLQEDVALLEDVVVVGYGTQRRADITGSVGSVIADEANVGLVQAPEQLIQGRVAGVNIIQNGGEPGAPVTVRIRGGTSISASNDPLYVIDGVPIDNSNATPSGGNQTDSGRKNPLVFLNPNDIESIDILKDASAAAIYGSRGANGVVLITTKRGREGQVQVEYDGYVSGSSFANELDLLSAEQYRNFVNAQGLPTVNLGNANTNWQDAVTQQAVSHSHNLSFGGGTSATQYRASVGYQDSEGIIINSGLERVSGRVNVNHKALNDRLTLDMRLTGSYFEDDRAPFQQTGGFEGGLLTNVMKFNPTLPVYNEDGTFFEIPGQTSVRNPVAMASQIVDNVKNTRSLGNIRANYEFVEGLTGTVNVGLDRQTVIRQGFTPAANPLGSPVGGEAFQASQESSSKLLELTGNYTNTFSDVHNVSLLGGYSWQEFNIEGFRAANQNFVSDLFGFNGFAAGANNDLTCRVNGVDQPCPGAFRQKSRLISFFGRVNYDFQGKYIFSGSLRRDGSSRFGDDNKWGVFPALTVGWRLSQESFLSNVDAISDLKLRVGWGVTGSQEIGNLRSLPIFGSQTSGNAVIGDSEVSGVAPQNFANPDLKWEETTQLNIGLDFELWEGRVSGAIEYYQKNTDDLLLEFEVPQPAAVPTRLANAGEMENTGIDIAINAFVFDQNDLTIELGATFNANQNEIIDLGGRDQIFTGRASGAGLSQTNTQILTPGEPFGTFWGPTFMGFCGVEIAMSATECAGLSSGAQAFSLDGQGNRELAIIGNAQPDFTYGFTGSVLYQDFDLSFFLRGESGRDVFNNTALEYTSKNLVNTNVNFLQEALNDPTPLAEAPVWSSRWVQDATFLRMENITLGYSFNNIANLGEAFSTFRRARIYVAANNLFVITNYDGFDPEVNTEASASVGNIPILSLGIDYTNYPRPRTFTAGIQLSF